MGFPTCVAQVRKIAGESVTRWQRASLQASRTSSASGPKDSRSPGEVGWGWWHLEAKIVGQTAKKECL